MSPALLYNVSIQYCRGAAFSQRSPAVHGEDGVMDDYLPDRSILQEWRYSRVPMSNMRRLPNMAGDSQLLQSSVYLLEWSTPVTAWRL